LAPLGCEDLRLLLAFGREDRRAAVALGAHLCFLSIAVADVGPAGRPDLISTRLILIPHLPVALVQDDGAARC